MFPPGFKLRSTTDMARQALFNILQNRIDFEEIKVLDLFAGSGSISYEFASRGCEYIDNVEKNPKHWAFIEDFSKKLGYMQMNNYNADVFKFITRVDRKYDLIFADPPYDHPEVQALPDLIFVHALLEEGGIFILEHHSKHLFGNHTHFKELRKYGSVHFSFFG